MTGVSTQWFVSNADEATILRQATLSGGVPNPGNGAPAMDILRTAPSRQIGFVAN